MSSADTTPRSEVPLTVPEILAALARGDSGRNALEGLEGAPLTRGGLARAVSGLASSLRAQGVSREDRVAVVLPGGPELAVTYLGVASAAVFAPLNPAYTASEYEFYLGDLQPRLLLTGLGAGEEVLAVAARLGIPAARIIKTTGAAAGLIELDGDGGEAALEPELPEPDLPEPYDVALVLHTSGTTSRPKVVPLTHRNLCASARNIGATLRLSPDDRSLVVMPLFHIHALVSSILAPLATGGSVIIPPGFYAPEILDWMDRFRPTWYTASPTIHQSVLARAKAAPERVKGHSLRFFRTGAAAMPAAAYRDIERVFGVPVIEFYGMTEAAQQITSNPMLPDLRKRGSVGLPDGPEAAIMDPAGELLTAGNRGEIVIRGANVTPGYADNPAANEASFRNGWFRTGDEGYFDADGYLWLSGRLKEMINRGGEKVWPLEVDEVLLDHPAVAQAVTFAIPHAQLGEEVGAALVLEPGARLEAAEIRQFVSERLADFKVPRVVRIVADIPKGPTGKLQRIGLATALSVEGIDDATSREATEYAAPRDAVEEELARIWSRILRVERIGVHDNFLGLGGDSVLAMRIIAQAAGTLGIKVSVRSLLDAATVAAMAEEVRRLRSKTEG